MTTYLHRPAPPALVRCYGSGWLTPSIRCWYCGRPAHPAGEFGCGWSLT